MNPAPILDLLEAFRRSKAMFAAVQLGVFDLLAMPHTAAALAKQLGADERALELLLDANVNLGLLTRSDSYYQNTELAQRYLSRSSPDTLAGYIVYSDEVLWRLWAHLGDAVREGSHRWPQAFGVDNGSALFTHFFRTPSSLRTFQQGMHGFGRISSPRVADAFDLSSYTHFCDLGGGTGHLASAVVERWPHMAAAVFDLPVVMPVTREFAGPEITAISGDFFTNPLPVADLYGLCRILHDWSDEKCAILLRKIYDSLPARGAVLIAEAILDDDHTGPRSAVFQSLNMLACTEGRERSAIEFSALLQEAGFGKVEFHRTGSPVDAILARKER